MKSTHFLKEGFVEDAQDVHMDHEVQMAREECYHAAEHAIALHKLLRNISEQQGLDSWISAKITLANDYLKTVHEYLEYQLMTGDTASDSTLSINMPMDTGLPVAEAQVAETSSGSVATVVNPTPKNKAKVGTLFGGTYKQKKAK